MLKVRITYEIKDINGNVIDKPITKEIEVNSEKEAEEEKIRLKECYRNQYLEITTIRD